MMVNSGSIGWTVRLVRFLLVGSHSLIASSSSSSSSSSQLVFSSSAKLFELPQPYEPNHQISSYQRTIDVAGTITRESSIIKLIRSSSPSSSSSASGSKPWLMAIENRRASGLSFMQVSKSGTPKSDVKEENVLSITSKGFDPEREIHYFEVGPLPEEEEFELAINSHFLNLTSTKPQSLAQDKGIDQGLYWEGDLLGGFGGIPNAFAKDVDIKVKIKVPTPRVFQQTSPPGFNLQHASGSNYVIYTNKVDAKNLILQPQMGYVHFHQPFPLMVISNLTRLVEISHWGNNVAIEDHIELENRGPQLKGPFSRLQHQSLIHMRPPGALAHILTGLTLDLPQGASSPYYIDTIGNVSTSRFRPSLPPTPPGNTKTSKLKLRKEAKFSKLELVPRYPIAGGWNYTFKIGYNLMAGRILKQKDEAKYILQVPFFTNAIDVPIETASLRVRLPEGSSDLQVYVPFPATEIKTNLIDKTYLDTTGRPTILIKKNKCTEKHSGDIYITYTRSPLKSLQKPFAVASWMTTIFLLAAVLRRFDWKIGY